MGHTAAIPDATVHQAYWPVTVQQPDTVATARLIPGSANRHEGTAGLIDGFRTAGKLLPAFLTRISPSHLGALLTDVVGLSAISVVAHAFLPISVSHRAIATYAAAVVVFGIEEGLYVCEKPNSKFRVLKSSIWALALTAILLARTRVDLAAVALLAVLAFVIQTALRSLQSKLHSSILADVNVLLIGSSTRTNLVLNAVRSELPSRHVKGILHARQFRKAPGTLGRIARQKQIDEVIIVDGDTDLVAAVTAECERNRLNVVTVPQIATEHATDVMNVDGIPFVTIRRESIPNWPLALKRALDVVMAVAGGLLTLPLMIVIAVAIKLDSPGPIFFLSHRVTHKGALFNCLKFRTMHVHSESLKNGLRARNERQGAFFKMAGDPRITRIGRFLRRYSLDELPQLWNVIRGDMSVVGPRPHPADDVERYALEHLKRLDFIPGMTGLWQVSARNDPSFEHCVALDAEYITRWSLMLDLRIMARTVSAILRGSGT